MLENFKIGEWVVLESKSTGIRYNAYVTKRWSVNLEVSNLLIKANFGNGWEDYNYNYQSVKFFDVKKASVESLEMKKDLIDLALMWGDKVWFNELTGVTK